MFAQLEQEELGMISRETASLRGERAEVAYPADVSAQ
jgi:hypothetical protein